MYLYDRKMVTDTNLKYAYSSSIYHVITMIQKLIKILNWKISPNLHPRGMKFQPKANNNRKAVFVCARHVVKRPSKRMRASIYIYIYTHID